MIDNPELANRDNFELLRVQQDFDERLRLLKEQISSEGEAVFRYDAPAGFALSVSFGDLWFSSVSYGDESSRIRHSDKNPMIVSTAFFTLGRGEYDEITLNACRARYGDKCNRIGGVFGPELPREALELLDATIVVDVF